jgi:hypothetical protein
VPAAAVIPAPIAYTKVVAVKKLVVGFLVVGRAQLLIECECVLRPSSGGIYRHFTALVKDPRHLL